MPDFYYTATDQTGKRITGTMKAASSQAVILKLESADYSNVILHTDDFAAALSEMMPAKVKTDGNFTASDYIEARTLTNVGFFRFLLKKLYWQLRWIFLILSILIFLNWRFSQSIVFFVSVFFLLILMPLGTAFWATLFSPTRKYNNMLEAFSWGRWNDVLEILPKLRKHSPAIELSGRKASALAALGRLDEGLEIMEPYANHPEIPPWMYFTRLAEVYEYAHEHERSLECRSQAHADAPENSTVLLGYANTLLKLNKDPQLAQKLIQEAKQQQLSDMLEMILPLIQGLLELNLGQPRLAFHLFVEGQKRLEPRLQSQPVARLYSDVGRAYAAIALAELGENEQAATLFQLALPRLQALNSTLTIERYERVA